MTKLTRNSLSKQTNLTINTLRYYEKLNFIKPDIIPENGYRYYCKSNILKLKNFMFTKEIGMKTSEGILFFKIKNLKKSYNYLLSHKTKKEKKIKKLQIQLNTINKSLSLIKNYQDLVFEKVLTIEEYYETNTNNIIENHLPIAKIQNLVDFTYEKFIKDYKNFSNINQCFSLNINLFDKNVKIKKSFFSKSVPSNKLTSKYINKSYLIIYFESDLSSLEKNIIKNYTLLMNSEFYHISYSNSHLELVLINSLFPLELNSKKIYALRTPMR